MHPLLDVDDRERAVHLTGLGLTARSAALTDAVVRASSSGRRLVLITPPDARITFPLHCLVRLGSVRWLVAHDGGYFDAGTGAVSDPDGHVTPDAAIDPAWTATGPDDATGLVRCSATVEHRATARTRLDAVDVLVRGFTGSAPLGWGTSEPVVQHWNVDSATALARRRAPEPTSLIVVGTDAIATVEVTRTEYGIREDVAMLAVLAGSEAERRERCAAVLAEMATACAPAFAFARTTSGRRDLTVEPRRPGPMAAAAVLLGPRAVQRIGTELLDSAPLPDGRRAGDPASPAMVWPVPGDGMSSWSRLGELVRHLGVVEMVDDATGWPQPGPSAQA